MKNFKKIILFVLCLNFLYNIMPVYADDNNYKTAIITASVLRFRDKPSTTDSNIILSLTNGNVVTVLDEIDSGNGCNDKWYKITYSDKLGYICSTYSNLLNETDKNSLAYVLEEKKIQEVPTTSSRIISSIPTGATITILGSISNWYYVKYDEQEGWISGNRVTIVPNEETDEEFKESVLVNFPKSYHPYLIKLHNEHPNWIFETYQTEVDFNAAVQKESAVGVSLTNSKYQGYYSIAGGSYDYTTDTFYVKEGSSWYAANSEVVAYYMDPRNYLNEINIFAFEKLSYDINLHTFESVQSTLINFPNLSIYANDFIMAAQMTGVSPIHLSSRVIQEIGTSTTAISGTTKFTCGETEYIGYYNFYNIGAYTSDNPVILGLCTAVNRGWDTPAKAIAGGASTISNGYVNAGQDTGYLQRFNVKDGKINTSHQYMTNIAAPMSESSITYNGYKKSNALEGNFVFKIPVYKEGTLSDALSALPSEGNPNNYLKTVIIDGNILETFNLDKTEYTISLPSNSKTVKIEGLPVSSKATVLGTGDIDLTKTKSVTLTVRAENKTTKDYKFTFSLIEPASIKVEDVINDISVKNDGTYIYGINNKETTNLIEEIKNKNASSIIEFKDSNGTIKQTKTFNTGDTLTVTIGSDTKTYKLVVSGDTNGDGKITTYDIVEILRHVMELDNLQSEKKIAADMNSDGYIKTLDVVMALNKIL